MISKKGKEARPHIGIFGKRNNGKSSLINALAGQEVAIVSDFAGTTTDPVKKTMEINGIGPVMLIDTAGFDDDAAAIGEKRVKKTMQVMESIDLALLIITAENVDEQEISLLQELKKRYIPVIIVCNKIDILSNNSSLLPGYEPLLVSALTGKGVSALVDQMKKSIPESAYQSTSLIGDIVQPGDLILLITPIDIEAPEGRMILPQVQTIRDALDNDCYCLVVKEREVDSLLKTLRPRPALAITDSQVFLKADASIPSDIPLTSFSIVLAKQKGDFEHYIAGTPTINLLEDEDRVLILESCSHHVSCDDIGRVKIPRWLTDYTGKKLTFDVVSGLDDVPTAITNYKLVIQCGGCVLTRRQLLNRLRPAIEAGVPVTNYGMAISFVQGIFTRAVAPFTTTDKNAEHYL